MFALVIWSGLVMLIAWPFILYGEGTSSNDTVRNVLIALPITLILTKVSMSALRAAKAATRPWVYAGLVSLVLVGVALSWQGALTADAERKERTYGPSQGPPGYVPPSPGYRSTFGQ